MSDTNHTVDPKFTYRDKRSGKDVVLYQGLLDAAHRAGMVSMSTEILQYPHADNDHTCIVRASVRLWVGRAGQDEGLGHPREYTGIGDANPKNVGANIAPHFIRMAETRAKARALRDALNVGMVTVEELGGDDDGHAASQPKPQAHGDYGVVAYEPANQPAPRRTPPSSAVPLPAAVPQAAGTPYTAREMQKIIDDAWQAAEDGRMLDDIKNDLNLLRHRMSKEQRADALEALGKIEARHFAPASVAG